MNSIILLNHEAKVLAGLEKGATALLVRPIDPQPPEDADEVFYWQAEYVGVNVANCGLWARKNSVDEEDTSGWLRFLQPSPHGKPGDVLVGLEEWGIHTNLEIRGYCKSYIYKADGVDDCKWRTAESMPEWASRTRIKLNGIDAGRVGSMTVPQCAMAVGYTGDMPMVANVESQFKKEWQSNYGDTFPWESNPWAWMMRVEKEN